MLQRTFCDTLILICSFTLVKGLQSTHCMLLSIFYPLTLYLLDVLTSSRRCCSTQQLHAGGMQQLMEAEQWDGRTKQCTAYVLCLGWLCKIQHAMRGSEWQNAEVLTFLHTEEAIVLNFYTCSRYKINHKCIFSILTNIWILSSLSPKN
jgi:hypothetical protein